GAAGVHVVDDRRGGVDDNGRDLRVTAAATADEIASAADLVKGKTSRVPLAIVRGLDGVVGPLDLPGARSIVRLGAADM
ncbi:coenzyme F420-0:L-glutamate ligase, partial [Mesorhizobium japonicum]|uniref:coenzyme F420-0:L-glutamate ligase n=1 Tax=Mesorhizobium japonicum TaxID=2066070 RepID=UPI003B5C031C